MKPKVIIIGGPTASGKSKLGIMLAKQLNAEIISCDSMQVYKQMDIGTAKPSKQDMQQIPHYMIDIVFPNEEFNVVKYIKMTNNIIEDILSRKKVPIIVGGTGLYIESLINNIRFSDSDVDSQYRQKLLNISKSEGNEKLYEELKGIDFEYANKIHINDTKRIIRGLEVYNKTGKTVTYYNSLSKEVESPYDFYLFGINIDREKLYQTINRRIDSMISNGLIEEVKGIYKQYNEFPTAMQGLGYKEVVQYLKNEYTYDEMVEKLKMETRRYAKRQLTWFKRYKDMTWFDEKNMSMDEMIHTILNEITHGEI